MVFFGLETEVGDVGDGKRPKLVDLRWLKMPKRVISTSKIKKSKQPSRSKEAKDRC